MESRMVRRCLHQVPGLLILTLLALALASCGEYGPAVCDASEMPAPILASPGGEADSSHGGDGSLTPTFHWYYTGECMPDRFHIVVSKYPSILYPKVNEDVDTAPPPPSVIEGGAAYPAFSWTLSEPLDRGAAYYWSILPYSGVSRGERSAWGAFLTEPLCGPRGATSPPQPAFPGNGNTLPDARVVFMWDDPSPCAVAGGNYTVEVSTSPTFLEGDTITLEAGNFTRAPMGDITMRLSYCAHYYWRVRFVPAYEGDPYGPYSDVWHFYTPSIDGAPGCAPATAVPTPASDLIPPVPESPEAMALQDANCRLGPSTQFDVAAHLTRGQVVPLVGRPAQESWWQVQPANLQIPCWVAGSVLQTYGDLTRVPLVIPPELPTPTPTEEPATIGCRILQGNLYVCVAPCPPNAKSFGACTP